MGNTSVIVKDSTRSVADGLCPVCAEDFSQGRETHVCTDCATAHHQDCWDYAGGCAIYGCKKLSKHILKTSSHQVARNDSRYIAILEKTLEKMIEYDTSHYRFKVANTVLLLYFLAMIPSINYFYISTHTPIRGPEWAILVFLLFMGSLYTSFFTGLNMILLNDQRKAIEEFVAQSPFPKPIPARPHNDDYYLLFAERFGILEQELLYTKIGALVFIGFLLFFFTDQAGFVGLLGIIFPWALIFPLAYRYSNISCLNEIVDRIETLKVAQESTKTS